MHHDREFKFTLEAPRVGVVSFGTSLVLGVLTAIASFGAFSISRVSDAKNFPLFEFLFAGGPTSLTIERDAVRVRYLLRKDRRVPIADLHVQWLPEELVLHDGRNTVGVPAFLFPGDSLRDCALELQPLAKQFTSRSVVR